MPCLNEQQSVGRCVRQAQQSLARLKTKFRAELIVIGDSDGTYDFREIPRFVEKLEDGADLVLGSRLNGAVLPGNMPFLHRYLGNPILTGILNFTYHCRGSGQGLANYPEFGTLSMASE